MGVKNTWEVLNPLAYIPLGMNPGMDQGGPSNLGYEKKHNMSKAGELFLNI